MNIFEIIGWIGSASYLISYYLLSVNKLRGRSITYQVMNVVGGLCLVVSAYDSKDKPNFFTNLIWMCIGIVAVISILKQKK